MIFFMMCFKFFLFFAFGESDIIPVVRYFGILRYVMFFWFFWYSIDFRSFAVFFQ